jgi:hypothetical protein
MTNSYEWKPRINCAVAANRDEFCVALTELEYDDPFSAIITFDGRRTQPWGRTDVQREINSVCALPRSSDLNQAQFAALSNEGDIYFVGQSTIREKIRGAGVQSPDAIGIGATFEVAVAINGLWVTGENGQLHERRGADDWQPIAIQQLQGERSGMEVSLSQIALAGEVGIYVLGTARPKSRGLSLEKTEQLKSNENWDDWFAAINESSSETAGSIGESLLFFWNGRDWREIQLPTKAVLRSIWVKSQSEIWIVGSNGAILKGNRNSGFKDVSFHGDQDKNLNSITGFRDRVVIASDYALHWFDGHILMPLKPKIDPSINKGVPTPLKVQAVDDVLFYFDYKHGVHRFDGENWEEIIIPSELLERNFKGLPPRG